MERRGNSEWGLSWDEPPSFSGPETSSEGGQVGMLSRTARRRKQGGTRSWKVRPLLACPQVSREASFSLALKGTASAEFVTRYKP